MKKSWLTNTRIPPTELREIIQTNSSPETIASSLNEAEVGYFKERNTFRTNRKYVYPHWKVCQQCGDLFQAMDHREAYQKKCCSDECVKAAQAKARKEEAKPPEERDGMAKAECSVCGGEFWRNARHLQRVDEPMCSQECNGVRRGEELKKHAHKGRDGWTEESMESYREKMTGENNPAWKGGATKKERKGNYKREIMVRCPDEFSEMARANGYVPEHRLKVAKALGKPLTSEECVHHMDHDNHNNDLENLALFKSNRDHKLFEAHGEPEPVWRGSNHNDTTD